MEIPPGLFKKDVCALYPWNSLEDMDSDLHPRKAHLIPRSILVRGPAAVTRGRGGHRWMAVDMGDIYQRPRELLRRKMEGLGQRPKELKEEEPEEEGPEGRKRGGARRNGHRNISRKEHQQCQMLQEAWWAESWAVPILATRHLDKKPWSVAYRGVGKVRNKGSATYKLCIPEQVTNLSEPPIPPHTRVSGWLSSLGLASRLSKVSTCSTQLQGPAYASAQLCTRLVCSSLFLLSPCTFNVNQNTREDGKQGESVDHIRQRQWQSWLLVLLSKTPNLGPTRRQAHRRHAHRDAQPGPRPEK